MHPLLPGPWLQGSAISLIARRLARVIRSCLVCEPRKTWVLTAAGIAGATSSIRRASPAPPGGRTSWVGAGAPTAVRLAEDIAPTTKSRKGSQSVNPYCVWTWWVSPCWVKLSRRLHAWWCPSVNVFKFQPCDHTPPRTQRLWFLVRCRTRNRINNKLTIIIIN